MKQSDFFFFRQSNDLADDAEQQAIKVSTIVALHYQAHVSGQSPTTFVTVDGWRNIRIRRNSRATYDELKQTNGMVEVDTSDGDFVQLDAIRLDSLKRAVYGDAREYNGESKLTLHYGSKTVEYDGRLADLFWQKIRQQTPVLESETEQ